ncbi:MAG: extracellular solute-binding protein [Alphaproteobacteria bacterium]
MIKASAGAILVFLAATLAPSASAQETTVGHGFAMHGDLKYGPDFTHFEYADPTAPRGGTVRYEGIGGFDNLNPYILKGEAAAGLGSLFESLMVQSSDEAFSSYGLIAETIEVPEDRSWVAFILRPEARWHDGRPITVEDVIFSFNILLEKGHPTYRYYYRDVASVEAAGERRVKFTFSGGVNRELPLIIGELPILPKHYWEGRAFDATTLEPPLGSGPYRVAAIDPGRSITYERIADYWGAELPVNRGRDNFDVIHYDYYRDLTIAREAFKAHQTDIRAENVAKEWATGYNNPAFQAGLFKKEQIGTITPQGMQGFVFNLRRAKFQDRRVREALILAFDFEWANKNLFFDAYKRTSSYFAGSELAAQGEPSAAELALLEPLRGDLPPEVFGPAYVAPVSDGSGSDRRNLRRALQLLGEAGWTIRDGRLVGPDGEPMTIEFLIDQPAFERVAAAYIKNLDRLGIGATIRQVDTAQYEKRTETFDFDVITNRWGQAPSPGNEQRNMWTSEAADTEGSFNYAGIKSGAVDALVDAVVRAPDRAALVAACRALDRALTWGYYVMPHWYLGATRLAYWDRFSRPPIDPSYGIDLATWWVDPAKDAALQAREKAP